MRYQIKAILWTVGMTLLLCMLNDHFNPYVYPPPVPRQEQGQTLKINLGDIPPMIYREIK